MTRERPAMLRVAGDAAKTLRTAWRIMQVEGWRGIERRMQIRRRRDSRPAGARYDDWIRRYDVLTNRDRERIAQRILVINRPPVISVLVSIHDTAADLLDQTVQSVRRQLYPRWELCAADCIANSAAARHVLRRHAAEDTRIKLVHHDPGVSNAAGLNSALAKATGEFIAVLGENDLLAEHGLFWVMEAIDRHPSVGLVYSDEDRIDLDGHRSDPYFKCAWNPELFLSHDIVNRLGVYRSDLVRNVGGFRDGLDGAECYDLALRCVEHLEPARIHHIPRVLYHHRRQVPLPLMQPVALSAGVRALNDYLRRRDINASVTIEERGYYRIRYVVPAPAPLVSLVVPTRNGARLISQCIDSIVRRTRYPNYEILVVDNGSDEPDTLRYLESLRTAGIARILRDERPFNFSALNNAAVTVADGSIIGFINNDIEVISPHWLDEMVSFVVQREIGAVGARLWYPNDTLQHGGVILGVGHHIAGHAHRRLARGAAGYFHRAEIHQALSAVTAACLLVRREVFEQVGGFDESLRVAYNDVDFCLRVRAQGYRNVWTPYAELYHHEAASRGDDDTREKARRYWAEVDYVRRRWADLLSADPAYNPNLTLDQEDFSLAWPPRVEVL